MFRRMGIALVAVVMGLLFLAPGAPAASDQESSVPPLLTKQAASAAELQAQVDLQLSVAPGGKQTAPNEVTYADGRFVVTFTKPGQVQPLAADCPGGWFCFYEHANFGYPRGRLSDQGWQDLATFSWHDRTDSVHNNSNTAVDFDNHTVGGHENDVFLFCVPAFGRDADVAPHRNRADHVYRYFTITTC
jgi:hypothetical protein